MVSDGTIEVNLVFHQVKAVIFSEMWIGTPYVSSVSEPPSTEKEQLELSKDNEHSTLLIKNLNIQNEATCVPSFNDPVKSISCAAGRQDTPYETPTTTNLDNITSKVVSHPSRTLYYPSLDRCVTLETDLQVL